MTLPQQKQEAACSTATISAERLLSVYSPANCMRHAGKLTTIAQAMEAAAPSLGLVQREQGTDFARGFVMAWLVYLNAILNLNKPMTEDQIELCAQEVVDTFYSLKVSDLTFLFKKIIAGHYGEFYESLTIPKVLSFFREYFEQRCLLAEELSQRAHADFASREEFSISKNLRRKWEGC